MVTRAVQAGAQASGLPEIVVRNVIGAESSGNPNAVSPTGAQGLMQLEPGTAKMMGVTNPRDPIQNAQGGSRYLAQLVERYHGNLAAALAAYNEGPTAFDQTGFAHAPPETQAYVRKIIGNIVSQLQAQGRAAR